MSSTEEHSIMLVSLVNSCNLLRETDFNQDKADVGWVWNMEELRTKERPNPDCVSLPLF